MIWSIIRGDIGKRGKVSVEDAKFNVFLFCAQIFYIYLSTYLKKLGRLQDWFIVIFVFIAGLFIYILGMMG